jgi:anti-sigma regulatory factor (Ser/Thr protein kinase)
MTARLETSGNRLAITGRLELADLRRVTAALHGLISRSGYQDVILDFSACTGAYPGPMAALCAQVLGLRHKGVDFDLILPRETRLASLFRSANWAHHMDPAHFGQSNYRGYTNLPLIKFEDAKGQTAAVNRLIDALLCSLPELERADFAAIEWSLNEITDNVLVHAQSPVGGLVQMSTYKHRRRVEFSVADPGLGIPATLRPGHPEIRDDAQALERAIREGVTRDPTVGQGNGLFGTFEVTRASGGYIHIHSGQGRLAYEKDQLKYSRDDVPYRGSLIVACMDCTNPAALASALRFGDKPFSPLDYIETHYEDATGGDLLLRLADEAPSFGSRTVGEPIRTKLANLVSMNRGRRVKVDLSGVALVSSSFADEVFGKLFATLGPLRFSQALELQSVSPTVQALIDKAIVQRMSQPRK